MERLDAALLVRMTSAMKTEVERLAAEEGNGEAAVVRAAVAAWLRSRRRIDR